MLLVEALLEEDNSVCVCVQVEECCWWRLCWRRITVCVCVCVCVCAGGGVLLVEALLEEDNSVCVCVCVCRWRSAAGGGSAGGG